MKELNVFVRLLQERVTGGPPVVKFIADVKLFFKAHKDVLQKMKQWIKTSHVYS